MAFYHPYVWYLQPGQIADQLIDFITNNVESDDFKLLEYGPTREVWSIPNPGYVEGFPETHQRIHVRVDIEQSTVEVQEEVYHGE